MHTNGELFNAPRDHENGSVVASSSVGQWGYKWSEVDKEWPQIFNSSQPDIGATADHAEG